MVLVRASELEHYDEQHEDEQDDEHPAAEDALQIHRLAAQASRAGTSCRASCPAAVRQERSTSEHSMRGIPSLPRMTREN